MESETNIKVIGDNRDMEYEFEYIGKVTIQADNEEEAYNKFNELPNEQLGKYIHSVEILDNDE